jgi:glycosyltransferase involved in cell wall biosynthesis
LDLYPDLAWVLGEFKSSEGFAFFHCVMRVCLRACDRVVAVAHGMRPYLEQHYGVEAEVIEPWPQEPPVFGAATPAVEGPHWLYSGNLGRAHDFETMLDAQRRLEERGVGASLVIQGDGQAHAQAKRMAEQLGLKRVIWSGYVESERVPSTLAAADVLVATQKEETRGMLWPSKLALASCVSRKILWIGPEWTGRPSHSAVFRPGEAAAVAEWLEEAFRVREGGLSSAQSLSRIRSARGNGRAQWLRLLQENG